VYSSSLGASPKLTHCGYVQFAKSDEVQTMTLRTPLRRQRRNMA
tara:strand:- start:38 stop:169 length:132 start_codon:yes stop_codon:yes gene_type:complete